MFIYMYMCIIIYIYIYIYMLYILYGYICMAALLTSAPAAASGPLRAAGAHEALAGNSFIAACLCFPSRKRQPHT